MDKKFLILQNCIKSRSATGQDPSDEEIDKWTSSFNNLILTNATNSFSRKVSKNQQKITAKARKPAIWYTIWPAMNVRKDTIEY